MSGGNASQKSAERWVEEVKQIVRLEGEYGELSLSSQRSFAGRRIGYLDQIKSPEGVAGLIEIILDPGFIEFDDQTARDENGEYRVKQVSDPAAGLRLFASWCLYNQPLVDEAVIPSIATDRSWEWRRQAIYDHRVDELVADCSAWSQEVQAGRMTFQMKGDPTRYNRYGKAASETRSVRREHRNQKEKDEVSETMEGEKEANLTWLYVSLGVLLALALGVLIKKKTTRA